MQTTYSERTQKVENQGEVNWTGVLWFSHALHQSRHSSAVLTTGATEAFLRT